MSPPLPLRRKVHAPVCPDPDELYGLHEDCPCPTCLNTGWLDGDPEHAECPCGAADLPLDERQAQLERTRVYR